MESKGLSANYPLSRRALRLDHVAIAVPDLEAAISFYRDVLGMELLARRSIQGQRTGMISAEMGCGNSTFVLVQGTEPGSQVARFIQEFGPGVQHVAVEVDDVEALTRELHDRGLEFDTKVIRGPGLTQIFSRRDPHTGVMFEFIQRSSSRGFDEGNIQSLFEQLETGEAY